MNGSLERAKNQHNYTKVDRNRVAKKPAAAQGEVLRFGALGE
jgi:hypothetical protein